MTTTTTASTSSFRYVHLNSKLDLHQSSVEGKKDESLSSQEFLVKSSEKNITIKAEVYPSSSRSLHTTETPLHTSDHILLHSIPAWHTTQTPLHTSDHNLLHSIPAWHTTQTPLHTSDHILSHSIPACSAGLNDLETIEVAPELLLASPRSQQDARLSADIHSSDTLELVIGNRDNSLTDFLYPNQEFVEAFPTVSIQPIPFTCTLKLDVMKLLAGSNIFYVTSDSEKCLLCVKKMKIYFSYQEHGKSYIYDLKKKEIIHPFKINNTFALIHKNCMGELTNEGRNYFFRIFEEKSNFSQRWKSLKWYALIAIIFYITFLLLTMTTMISLTVYSDLEPAILSILWILMTLFIISSICLLKLLGRKFLGKYELMGKSDRHLKLVIWKPSSISTVV